MTRRGALKRLRQGCRGAGAEVHWEPPAVQSGLIMKNGGDYCGYTAVCDVLMAADQPQIRTRSRL